jgi:hypothetical protein
VSCVKAIEFDLKRRKIEHAERVQEFEYDIRICEAALECLLTKGEKIKKAMVEAVAVACVLHRSTYILESFLETRSLSRCLLTCMLGVVPELRSRNRIYMAAWMRCHFWTMFDES